MAKTITITNGEGTGAILNGNYSVGALVNGYDNSSINPSSVNIVAGTNSYAFTISANGTLTLHVSEDGTQSGTPIIGATFVRLDSNGQEYGNQITTNSEGNAIFENVPFASENAPIIYFKQTASDSEHEFNDQVQSITMSASTQTLEIQNAAPANRTFTLTDANYENLPIITGTMTLE